eukprot:2659827-Ditylum_brightwellii.AAC.2
MLEELPAKFDGKVATLAENHLHEVNDDATKLETVGEFFHHNVAKLLFLSKRARPDIQTAVSFLTTRVKAPNVDDHKKLIRVMRYLRVTVDLPLRLEANGTDKTRWWVDTAFAVHGNMRGHTGSVMSMGGGAAYSVSVKQKLNTRSLTKTEVVGVDDMMPQVIWT